MQRLILSLLIACSVASAALAKVTADKPPPVTVSGKVLNSDGLPCEHADVYLVDSTNHEHLSDQTDKEGHFSIKHEHNKFDSLHVVPPVNSGMAEAILSEISKSQGRHSVVILKKGIVVTGRVLAGGRPLKGVTVRAIPQSGDAIHDGAEAVTNRKGEYRLLVTPGEKLLEVSGVRDNSVVGLHREKRMLRASGDLPDIEVPANRTADAR